MKKMIIIGLLLITVVLAVVVGYVVMNKDGLLKSAIEQALALVLQVDVTIGDLKSNLTEGKIDVYNLTIGNPPNYESAEAISFAHATVSLEAASVTSDTPYIILLDIDKPTLSIEQAKRVWNFNQLIDNAAAFAAKYAAAPTDAPQEDMKLIIDKVRIAEAAVIVHAPLLPNPAKFNLPTIEMTVLGTQSNPTTVAAAIEIVFKKLFKESIRSVNAFMPEGIFTLLEGGVELLQQTGETVKERVDQLKEGLTGGDPSDLKETTENVKEGLKGLLNRK